MSTRAEMAERHGRILTELSELGLSLARTLHERASQAADDETAASLSMAFHRVSRSVRQTLALESKLDRDRTRADRDDHAETERCDKARTVRREAYVRAAVERAIWTEAEGDEAERLSDAFDTLLEMESLSDGFLDEAVDAQIARILYDLGLPNDDWMPDAGLGGRPPPTEAPPDRQSPA